MAGHNSSSMDYLLAEDHKLEIQHLKERVQDLEKWLVVMLNNFYDNEQE